MDEVLTRQEIKTLNSLDLKNKEKTGSKNSRGLTMPDYG
jgi:hypothetical protein